MVKNLRIAAGAPERGGEPIGRVTAVPLFRSRYCLLTSTDAPLGNRDKVTWAEVAQVPLCLLTPDTQTRRIIEGLLRAAGGDPKISPQSGSMTVLYSHVRTGRRGHGLPARLAAV